MCSTLHFSGKIGLLSNNKSLENEILKSEQECASEMDKGCLLSCLSLLGSPRFSEPSGNVFDKLQH